MGLWDRFILPRLLDAAMRNREVARYRARIVPLARGRVVEIGVGSALNLPFYGGAVEHLYAVDPSPALLAMGRRRIDALPFEVELASGQAESLPLADASVDSAVTTFTLCTVADPRAALAELRRVLKPGGRLLFAEHGLAPDAAVVRWQRRINPVWKKLAGGCHVDRPIDALIERAGFALLDVRRGYARGPRALAYVYDGEARAD